MAHLLPHMTQEPPPGYVAFVERHLEPLRRDATRITGDERDAGEIYTSALTDVATRWYRFELIRSVLRRRDPAEAYLERAVARRAANWHGPEDENPHVEVWAADRPPPPPVPLTPDGHPEPTRVSAAVRIARAQAHTQTRTRRPPLATASAAAEAGVAWWHAYEAHLRHRRIAGTAVALLVVMFIYALQIRLAA